MRNAILCLIGCLGCTSEPEPPKSLPDRVDLLAVVERAVWKPCGAVVDYDFEGAADLHYRYEYDGLGRSTRDVVTENGSPYEETRYEWDNLGHLTRQSIDAPPFEYNDVYVQVYDTLGRRTEVHGDTRSGTHTWGIDARYSMFDDLGHAAEAVLVVTDDGAARTLSATYRYDELGRQIFTQRRESDGTIRLTVETVFDDPAREIRVTFTTPTRRSEITHVYDEDFHRISETEISHVLETNEPETTVWTYAWRGDRLLSETLTSDVFTELVKTYLYRCD